MAWQLPLEPPPPLGSLVAVQVLESFGPQEYQLTPEVITSRMEAAYGADAAKEVAQHLGS